MCYLQATTLRVSVQDKPLVTSCLFTQRATLNTEPAPLLPPPGVRENQREGFYKRLRFQRETTLRKTPSGGGWDAAQCEPVLTRR